MKYDSPKQVAWDILQCAILWYEGANPEYYGYEKQTASKGKALADALYKTASHIYTLKVVDDPSSQYASKSYEEYKRQVNTK